MACIATGRLPVQRLAARALARMCMWAGHKDRNEDSSFEFEIWNFEFLSGIWNIDVDMGFRRYMGFCSYTSRFKNVPEHFKGLGTTEKEKKQVE